MMPTMKFAVIHDLAPSGRIRAAINLGNPVLARRHPRTGEPNGACVDIARELGQRLGVALELVTFDAAGRVCAALKSSAWDVAFLAIDPARATEIAFTAPYVVMEGAYLVRAGSPLQRVEDADRRDVRIAVGKGAAYDFFLSRTLRRAQLVRADTSAAAIDLFATSHLDAAAGVRQPLTDYAQANPGFRVIDGHFTVIEQAMAIPKGRDHGLNFLRTFVEDLKATGFIAEALRRSGQRDATVAPPVGH